MSSIEYTKRNYFDYFCLDIYNNHDEDIKKFFRVTNRFINDSIKAGGKVLIHDQHAKSRAPAFLLAYLINNLKITLKKGSSMIREKVPNMEMNDYFLKQLEAYDLEKLAMLSTKKSMENNPK